MRAQRLVFLAASGLAALYPILLFAQQGPDQGTPPSWRWHGPGYMWGFGWGFWLMPFMMLLFFLVCVGVFRLLLGRSGHRWGPPWHMMDRTGRFLGDPTHSALQILNERYAKGEIDKPEYEERKATILSGREP
jgi:putative membrane protein